MIIDLIRFYNPDGLPTYGWVRSQDGIFICRSLELPWHNNVRKRSCIPGGRYEIMRRTREDGTFWNRNDAPCFLIRNVPDRDDILVHLGNYLRDTEGCIMFGETISHTFPAIWKSGHAMNRFAEYLAPLPPPHTINIYQYHPMIDGEVP